MNLIIKSAKKTSPIALAGRPKEKAIKVVTIEAIIRQETAFNKLLDFDSICTSFP